MAQVFLTGNVWKFRALLRAQLLEEGVEIEAFEDVKSALESLHQSAKLPRLFLNDLTASETPAQDVAQLAPWARKLPIWIVLRHGEVSEETLKSCGFERILHLPVDFRVLVSEIEARLQT